jgi:bacillithiol biosynthesis cysteine-adding enzyme BshC
MKLDGLREAIDEVIKVFGSSPFAEELKDIIESSFKQSELYSEFNFELVNRLFADHGLIVVNMDDRRFKEAFLPFAKRELLEEISSKEVRATQSKLEERGIKEQAHVRDINLFWINRDSRDRIVKVAEGYKIGEDLYSEKDLLEKLESEPQNISPNVVMRPIFQELILPNLAYIGGGGEIAYWLERKSQFARLGLPYPMLIRRNSALFVPGHVVKNIGKLGFKVTDFLKSSDELVKAYLDMHTEDDYNLGTEKDELRNIFKNLAEKSKSVDPTLAQYILAEGAKQEKVLDRISSKITKAAKEKNDVALNKISKLRDKIYPSGKLQERFDSFIPFYLRYGSEWFDHLLEILDPMNKNYLIIEES